VNPSKEQYEANIYEGIRLQLTTFVGECHEEMMVNTHKRNREMGEGKLKFEASRQADLLAVDYYTLLIREHSVVMSTSVCLSVCPRAYLRNHTLNSTDFLCILPASMARSSSGTVAMLLLLCNRTRSTNEKGKKEEKKSKYNSLKHTAVYFRFVDDIMFAIINCRCKCDESLA